MNWLDIVIAILLIGSIIGGAITGLIKTILSLAGLILGIFLAGHFYAAFAGVLTFLPEQAARITAYIIILLAVIIIFGIIASLLDKVLHAILLGWLNHLLGGVIGLISGSIFVGAILVIWAKYGGGGNIISGSFLGTFIVDRFPLVMALLPSEFNTIKQFFQ
jgi:membrane protein required for colicin V production